MNKIIESPKIILLILLFSGLLGLLAGECFGQTIQWTQFQRAPGPGYIPLTNGSGVGVWTPSATVIPTPTFTPGWSLSGNAITTNTNFIGTTSNRSLLFKTNNSTRFKIDSAGVLRMYTTSSTSTVNGSFYYDGGQSGNNGFNFYSNDPSDLSYIFRFGNSSNSISYYGDHSTNNWLVVPNGRNFTISNDGGNSPSYQVDENQQHAWINKNLTTPVNGVHIYNWTGASYTNQTAGKEISPYGMAMGTIQYNAGTLAKQRGLVVDQPSVSFVSTSTLTEGSSLSVAGPVMVGTNGICPMSSGVSIGRLLAVPLNTNVVIGTGLYCNAPTGAQSNYSALFTGGNVGIGTTAPSFNLDVTGTGRFTSALTTPLVYGSSSSAGTLTLSSTSNATKGKILFGSSAYDEVNNRLGINNTSPTYALDVTGMAQATTGFLSNGVCQFAQINGFTNFLALYGKLSNGGVVLGYNAGTTTATFDANGMTLATGGIAISTAGKGVTIKEGTNGMSGSATLTSGTVTVSNTNISATSRIFFTGNGTSNAGSLSVTKNAGVGFTINSSNPSDARSVDYFIITGN